MHVYSQLGKLRKGRLEIGIIKMDRLGASQAKHGLQAVSDRWS